MVRLAIHETHPFSISGSEIRADVTCELGHNYLMQEGEGVLGWRNVNGSQRVRTSSSIKVGRFLNEHFSRVVVKNKEWEISAFKIRLQDS